MNRQLDDISFQNSFVDGLNADADTSVSSRQVLKAHYSLIQPEASPNPKLLFYSKDLAEELNLDSNLSEKSRQLLSGNSVAPSMKPFAACYGGHQFGNWAGQLGDGRAITLGEIPIATSRDVVGAGKSFTAYELQLKGAGQTPYSRRGDGKAVLRSSIRELVASEAIHYLGIPTTRALSLTATGENVARDMFYNGNVQNEAGAICSRISPTFIRFGNFEIFASRADKENFKKLADFTIEKYFPDLKNEDYVGFLKSVCSKTAKLMTEWHRVGFTHGVMNTDNMSILGLTIDYGPYGFLDTYDPLWTPNTTDLPGRRYCFGRQGSIGLWNITRLAESFTVLLENQAYIRELQEQYSENYESLMMKMLHAKIGVTPTEKSNELVYNLDEILRLTEVDYTNFHRRLALFQTAHSSNNSITAEITKAYFANELYVDAPAEFLERLAGWLNHYLLMLSAETKTSAQRFQEMNSTNPYIVPRNYILSGVIEAADQGDLLPLERLMAALKRPYDESQASASFALKRPEWARSKPGSSSLSCSS